MNKTKLNFNLSASTINSFNSCQWSFQQDKILKRSVEQLPSAALVLGQAFHKLLELFYKRKTWKTYDLFQNWEKMFEVEAKLQNATKLPELKYALGKGFTLLKNWVAMAKANGWLHEAYMFGVNEGIEYEFLLPYENDKFIVDVHGFMDLVIEVNNKVYILDWKTGKHSKDKYFLQAVLYSWALYKKHGIIEECVRFVHPSKDLNTVINVNVKNEDYFIIVNAVEDMFRAIETDNFIKNDGDNCKWCKWIECEFNTNKALKESAKKSD